MKLCRRTLVLLTPLVMVLEGALAGGSGRYTRRWASEGGSGDGAERAPRVTAPPLNVGSPLYPRDSETRDVRKLDGLWNFRLSPPDPEFGFKNKWFSTDLAKTGPVINMPVPASYNDITEDAAIRDHVGLVWYDRRFFVPDTWRKAEFRVWLRFSSVHYAAQVWVNGEMVMHHEIGHLPFLQEITKVIRFGTSNLVTVACDNTLLRDTVPQGTVSNVLTDSGMKIQQDYTFDFFNYAGIHRSVFLFSTPNLYIDDIIVNTDIVGSSGFVTYNVTYKGYMDPEQKIFCIVELLDKEDNLAGRQFGFTGVIDIPNAQFWWPYLMHEEVAYLYTMQVTLVTNEELVLDVYREKIGIRTISWTNTTFLINHQPIYLRGFGRHEDSDIRGKGLDYALFAKDYNLIKWVGANAYRTSHYPYSEELYYMADEEGIMIIDECPSGDTDIFSDTLLEKHKDSLTQLIKRDKNHPSVIVWSLANEPRTQNFRSDSYFEQIAAHVRGMDMSRPLTIALSRHYTEDYAAKHLDIISFNRYNAWYSNPGKLDLITSKVVVEAQGWHTKFNKPVLMSEYGADTLPGLHLYPEYVWSEEYQVELMSKHFMAFDELRRQGFFIGEFIWNFADFKTAQTVTRVGGNKKGIFTRDRQPKASAHHLRKRYFELAKESNNATLPDKLYSYTSPTADSSRKTEL